MQSMESFRIQYNCKMTEPGKSMGRSIPSFSELLASCNLAPTESKYITSNNVHSNPSRVYLTPNTTPYSIPFDEDAQRYTNASRSTLYSPSNNRMSVNHLCSVRNDKHDQETAQTTPESYNEVITKASTGVHQQDPVFPQDTIHASKRQKVKSPKSPSRSRAGKHTGALMEHERIIFTLAPRPAMEHSPSEVAFPSNLLNKNLCLKYNTQCSQCQSKKTPEWRSGPTGSRTLCNACGLFFAKLSKKLGPEEAKKYFLELKKAGNVFDRRIGPLNE